MELLSNYWWRILWISDVPWDHFSPLAWTITALLILVFFIILLALGLAVWQYRDESEFNYFFFLQKSFIGFIVDNRLKRRLSEQEVKIRQQNEYFTGKLHKQMEAEIAVRFFSKFDDIIIVPYNQIIFTGPWQIRGGTSKDGREAHPPRREIGTTIREASWCSERSSHSSSPSSSTSSTNHNSCILRRS